MGFVLVGGEWGVDCGVFGGFGGVGDLCGVYLCYVDVFRWVRIYSMIFVCLLIRCDFLGILAYMWTCIFAFYRSLCDDEPLEGPSVVYTSVLFNKV